MSNETVKFDPRVAERELDVFEALAEAHSEGCRPAVQSTHPWGSR
jgi:hypothetical protein